MSINEVSRESSIPNIETYKSRPIILSKIWCQLNPEEGSVPDSVVPDGLQLEGFFSKENIAKIKTLDLRDTGITDLSPCILKLTALKILDLRGCNVPQDTVEAYFKGIPMSIIVDKENFFSIFRNENDDYGFFPDACSILCDQPKYTLVVNKDTATIEHKSI